MREGFFWAGDKMSNQKHNFRESIFDDVIERRNSDSTKYDFSKWKGDTQGVIPMWLADMDFRSPECVAEALSIRLKHGIFGYSEVTDRYKDAVRNWNLKRFEYSVRPEEIVAISGVILGIATAIRTFSDPGDSILIQTTF